MAVITISGQIGTGAREVGRLAAEQLQITRRSLKLKMDRCGIKTT